MLAHTLASRRPGPAQAAQAGAAGRTGRPRSRARGSHLPAWGRRALTLVLVASLALAGVAVSCRGADARQAGAPTTVDEDGRQKGPWYTDLRRHWAEPFIRVLWQEGVTPPPAGRGEPVSDTWTRPGPFRPDVPVTARDFGGMVVRVFPGGRFPPPSVALALSRSPYLAGFHGPGLSLGPGAVLDRREAVDVLIDALGLAQFAEAMDAGAAASYLRLFRDGWSVPPASRRTMALAVLLGIIRGYPDDTLRPERLMTRAEGSTVIYRSCLLLAEALPNPFSPDGDGAEDETSILLGSLRNKNARGWDLDILDPAGSVLRSLSPADPTSPMPSSVTWDGRDSAGRLLPPAVYYYRGWLRDREGLVHWSALKPIVIEAKSLRGWVHPTLVLPGGRVSLTADASGAPGRVTAVLSSFPGAGVIELSPTGTVTGTASLRQGPHGAPSRRWAASFEVPPGASPGPCTVTFTAWFAGTTRTAVATFDIGEFKVDGALEPNPVEAGRTVEVSARPNLEAGACLASFLFAGGTTTLTLTHAGRRSGENLWQGSLTVPPGTEPGLYEVVLAARRNGQTARATLWLEVTAGEDTLIFLLSD